MISCSTSIASELEPSHPDPPDTSSFRRDSSPHDRARRSSFADEELRERLTNVVAMGVMQRLEVVPVAKR